MSAYAVVIEGSGDSYSAYVPDLPGCVAAGASLEETLALIREAIAAHLALLRENGDPIPSPTAEVRVVEVA
jgi:predicted RNase H-like HicB family nuclease